MSQPGARSKDSSPHTPHLGSETTQGDIYMKATNPRHPSFKRGGKKTLFTDRPRTGKGYWKRYFQGTRLQVIFGLRPLVGLNSSIVTIFIAAFCLCLKGKCVSVGWKVDARKAQRTSTSSHHRGAAPLLTGGELCFTQSIRHLVTFLPTCHHISLLAILPRCEGLTPSITPPREERRWGADSGHPFPST